MSETTADTSSRCATTGTHQSLIPKHVAKVPSILAASIKKAHIGQSFETLDSARLGVLTGVRVLLEFEGGETLQLEHGERLKVAPQEEQPSQWSLSPYVPPRTPADTAAALAAIPEQIAVEQETVRKQLAEGKRLVVNAIAGAETIVHDAACNAIEYQVNRALAWGEVRADLSNALGRVRWNARSIDATPARMPRMVQVGVFEVVEWVPSVPQMRSVRRRLRAGQGQPITTAHPGAPVR